ncbi:MAG: HEPN domain-containing protein [Nanoarchaeota archaeon]
MRVDNLLIEIDETISNINKFNPSALERDYLAKFLAVLISGIYEECIKDMITQKICSTCSQEAMLLVENYLYEHFRNPTNANIVELLSKFNSKWSDDFNNPHIIHNILKSGVDLIVENRNHFAHGQPFNATLHDITEAHKRGKEVIKKLREIILID